MKTREELEKIIENAIKQGETLEGATKELQKEVNIDPNIPGGVEFPSIEHIYRRFFNPMPRNSNQLRNAIMQALRAAERLGTRKGPQ